MQHTVTRPAIAILALALLGALLGPAVQSAQLGGPGPALPPRQAVDVTATPDSGLGLDQGSAGGIVPGEVVVRFKPELGARPVSPKRAAAILGSTRALATVRRSLVDPGSYIVGVPPGSEADTAATLAADPSVASADPNLIRHIHAQRLPAPNDPLYALQWGYAQVNAPAAWSLPQQGGVVVAVLDTGLDLNHPEFAGRIAPGANFANPGNSPQDDNGHGTHVAGIIAATGDNGIGGVGLAWQARIMPIKVADSSGNLTSEAWLNGLAYAIQNGAQVVNMSFGGTSFSGTEQSYIDEAWDRGIVLVASAGNSGDGGNPVEYPAAYNNVVSVAATGRDNTRAYYSEYNQYVAVAAPGGDARFGNDPNDKFIISTWPLNLTSNFQTGYGREVGTSQAAPFVSGLAALMLSTSPAWTNQTLVQRIESTATDLGPPGRDDQYGYGLINVAAAVGNPPGPPAPPTPVPTATPRPTATPPVAPTPTIGPGCLFAEVCPPDPVFPFVQDLLRRGALSGYNDNTFRPNTPITRAEVAKMIVLGAAFELNSLNGPHFADVPPTDPFYPYVETAYGQGLMTGYRDGSFRPYGPVTRGQLAKMIVLARGWALADPDRASFTDVPYGSTYYYYVETAVGLQVMSGYGDNTFRPALATTRAQTSKILDIALATYRPGFGSTRGALWAQLEPPDQR